MTADERAKPTTQGFALFDPSRVGEDGIVWQPVTHAFTHDLPHLESLRVEGGFLARFDPACIEAYRPLFDAAVFDPHFDRHMETWCCPGCGRPAAELPHGHAWSYDSFTQNYGCGDVPVHTTSADSSTDESGGPR